MRKGGNGMKKLKRVVFEAFQYATLDEMETHHAIRMNANWKAIDHDRKELFASFELVVNICPDCFSNYYDNSKKQCPECRAVTLHYPKKLN